MDELDEKILMELQNDFPLSCEPYQIIADRLGIGVDELWRHVEQLIDSGVIRRVGASLDSRQLGYCSTLAAISVEDSIVEQASEIIGGYSEITHSYLRSGRFNIWFTIIASNNEIIENIIEEIQSALSLESSQILNLPMKRLFKLNARFNISPQ